MTKLISFVVVSIFVLLGSLPSLRNPKSHGFYRFFAFETILVLLLVNIGSWLLDPLSAHQPVSWFLLGCSIVLAVHGFYLLRVVGRPTGDFENTTQLVIVGAYKRIRHPLYASLIFLAWGICLKDCTLLTVLLSTVTSVFLYGTARAEETENLARFGPRYVQYVRSTKMFIPFAF